MSDSLRRRKEKTHAWKTIKLVLSKNIGDPLTTTTVPSKTITLETEAILTNPAQIFSTKSEVEDRIIEQNIHLFSIADDFSIGLCMALYDVISPHNASKFYNAVLKVQLIEKDKENIDFVEAFELLQMIVRLGLLKTN